MINFFFQVNIEVTGLHSFSILGGKELNSCCWIKVFLKVYPERFFCSIEVISSRSS